MLETGGLRARDGISVCDSQNPELVARLEKIRARQEQKEYDQMVKNIDSTVSEGAAPTVCSHVSLVPKPSSLPSIFDGSPCAKQRVTSLL